MTDDDRPDPDALLSRLSREEEKSRRGRLKIFFGFSAGVGKTYAMLNAAKERNQEGLDVLIGLVETHGRPETESLLEGFKILPPLEIKYKSLVLKEFDLDAALTRKPDVVLVDELAHTNAPGMRHPKRWNDVVEVLDAGIDVYTTLNVQHIESLSDVVASATGVRVQETVPDTLFDMAEDVVIVDIDEDELIQRLREGKVYLAPGARARAADNFFKKSNLQALREIALRRTADRVDAKRETNNIKDEKTPVFAENVLVCIDVNAMAAQTVRTARRFASALRAPWEAVHVQGSGETSEDNARFLGAMERMVERLGGTMTVLRGIGVSDTIVAYAREKRFTKIVVGRNTKKGFKRFLTDLFINRLIAASGTIDVYIVMGENTRIFAQDKHASLFVGIDPLKYVFALIATALFVMPAILAPGILGPTNQAALCLIGAVVVAEKLGLGPAFLYVLLTSSAPYLLVLASGAPPYPGNLGGSLFSFLVLFAVGCVVAFQAFRLRARAVVSGAMEKQSREMFLLTKNLASVHGRLPVAELAAAYIVKNVGGAVTVWMIDEHGHPSELFGSLPKETYHKEFGALEWCFENDQPSGRGTATLPSAQGLYLPLTTSTGTIGVLGHFRDADVCARDNLALLEATTGILATTLDRVRAEESAASRCVATSTR